MASSTAQAQADSSTTTTNKAASSPAKPKAKRYAGKITALDADAKTVSVTSASGVTTTLKITSKTRIKKDGEPATLADAAVGDKVSGSERQDTAGDWLAGTLNIGEVKKHPTPAPAPTPPPADKQ